MFSIIGQTKLIQMNTRKDVLRLYKQLLKLGKEWVAKEPTRTEIERKLIKVIILKR